MDLDKVYKECVRFGLAGEKSGWLEGVSRGIINIGTILAYINMKKEQKVLEVHTYAITKLEGGRNTTYVYDDTKKYHRRLVRAKNYKELIPFRAERAHAEHLNYGVPEWVYLFARSTSMRSIKLRCARMGINKLYDFYFSAEDIDNASYEKYVKGTRIDTLPLKSIKTIDLENWAIEVLLKYEMTAKNFNTHKLVVTGPGLSTLF